MSIAEFNKNICGKEKYKFGDLYTLSLLHNLDVISRDQEN